MQQQNKKRPPPPPPPPRKEKEESSGALVDLYNNYLRYIIYFGAEQEHHPNFDWNKRAVRLAVMGLIGYFTLKYWAKHYGPYVPHTDFQHHHHNHQAFEEEL
jgi:hypothetical protein